MRWPLALLLLAACAPVPETAETSVLLGLDAPDRRVGQWALCRPEADGTFRLQADGGVVSCLTGGAVFGHPDDRGPFAGRAVTLGDGTPARLIPLRTAGLLDSLRPGTHVLAARQTDDPAPLSGPVPEVSLAPGAVLWLGRLGPEGLAPAPAPVLPGQPVTSPDRVVELSCVEGRRPLCRTVP